MSADDRLDVPEVSADITLRAGVAQPPEPADELDQEDADDE